MLSLLFMPGCILALYVPDWYFYDSLYDPFILHCLFWFVFAISVFFSLFGWDIFIIKFHESLFYWSQLYIFPHLFSNFNFFTFCSCKVYNQNSSLWSVLLYFLFLYVMLLLLAFVNRIQFLPYLYCFYNISNLMIHFNYPTFKFLAGFSFRCFCLTLTFLFWCETSTSESRLTFVNNISFFLSFFHPCIYSSSFWRCCLTRLTFPLQHCAE